MSAAILPPQGRVPETSDGSALFRGLHVTRHFGHTRGIFRLVFACGASRKCAALGALSLSLTAPFAPA
eukprot:3097584-Prymnesium_polylepis.1